MQKRSHDLLINLGVLLGTLIPLIGGGEIGLRITGIEKGRVVPPPLYQANANPALIWGPVARRVRITQRDVRARCIY